jgi:hypothetical protein
VLIFDSSCRSLLRARRARVELLKATTKRNITATLTRVTTPHRAAVAHRWERAAKRKASGLLCRAVRGAVVPSAQQEELQRSAGSTFARALGGQERTQRAAKSQTLCSAQTWSLLLRLPRLLPRLLVRVVVISAPSPTHAPGMHAALCPKGGSAVAHQLLHP